MKNLMLFSLALINILCYSQSKLELKVHGVQINVTNIENAIDFYSGIIGFEIVQKSNEFVELRNDGIALYLNKTNKKREVKYKIESQTILVLHVNNLDKSINQLTEKGVIFIEGKNENGVGYSAKFKDPFGNVLSILEQSKFPVPVFKEPKIYNVGYYLPNMDEAKEFYCEKLNFTVRSNVYLPAALPLNQQDSIFAFMLHYRKVQPTMLTPDDTQTLIVFETKSLKRTTTHIKRNEIDIIKKAVKSSFKTKQLFIKDPFGCLSIIVEN